MSTIRTSAPKNPYRQDAVPTGSHPMFGELSLDGSAGRSFPRRHDTPSGPGLSAADLDAIARQHHLDGHAAGAREVREEMQPQLDAAHAQLAEVYDEGYTAGRMGEAQDFAKQFRRRLLDVHFMLRGAEAASRTKKPEAIAALRAQLDALMQEVETLAGGDAEALAQALAADVLTRTVVAP